MNEDTVVAVVGVNTCAIIDILVLLHPQFTTLHPLIIGIVVLVD